MEISDYKSRISGSDQQSEDFKRKIQRLLEENKGLDEELRGAQETIRLSTAQQNKLMNEFSQHREENTQVS